MIYLRLFWEFFKTGLFAIGGGMATLPFLHDIGEATGWFTNQELTTMIAVSPPPAPSASTWPPMWASPLPVSPAR